ncbi:hypothetical protein LEP1GSC059_4359 [Leptospira noguchii serovar Panama str. CZ214]|uniref:Uncharacterized protein n=1 Tax=Leptospira noguchii serovar Panama str. CZ214 TaxID=1001595 RepID=T0GXW6_9LEPT|nr:hypothetical protein LEP1GSC059_4359 [Leptospira noguchii serovar Panama str. CZ214]
MSQKFHKILKKPIGLKKNTTSYLKDILSLPKIPIIRYF